MNITEHIISSRLINSCVNNNGYDILARLRMTTPTMTDLYLELHTCILEEVEINNNIGYSDIFEYFLLLIIENLENTTMAIDYFIVLLTENIMEKYSISVVFSENFYFKLRKIAVLVITKVLSYYEENVNNDIMPLVTEDVSFIMPSALFGIFNKLSITKYDNTLHFEMEFYLLQRKQNAL